MTPRYAPEIANYGATDERGVHIGPAAFADRAVLRSTLIHEGAHVRQLREGNYAIGGTPAGNVNEIEAYYEELQNAGQTGLSEEEQRRVAADLYKRMDVLFDQGPVGEYYLKRILLDHDFTLRPQDRTSLRPAWINP